MYWSAVKKTNRILYQFDESIIFINVLGPIKGFIL